MIWSTKIWLWEKVKGRQLRGNRIRREIKNVIYSPRRDKRRLTLFRKWQTNLSQMQSHKENVLTNPLTYLLWVGIFLSWEQRNKKTLWRLEAICAFTHAVAILQVTLLAHEVRTASQCANPRPQRIQLWTGEKAQWLRALPACAKDPSSVPSTTSGNSVCRGFKPSFGLQGFLHTCGVNSRQYFLKRFMNSFCFLFTKAEKHGKQCRRHGLSWLHLSASLIWANSNPLLHLATRTM